MPANGLWYQNKEAVRVLRKAPKEGANLRHVVDDMRARNLLDISYKATRSWRKLHLGKKKSTSSSSSFLKHQYRREFVPPIQIQNRHKHLSAIQNLRVLSVLVDRTPRTSCLVFKFLVASRLQLLPRDQQTSLQLVAMTVCGTQLVSSGPRSSRELATTRGASSVLHSCCPSLLEL